MLQNVSFKKHTFSLLQKEYTAVDHLALTLLIYILTQMKVYLEQ